MGRNTQHGCVVLLALACLVIVGSASASADPWVLVDSRERVVSVMGQTGPLETFHGVAFGKRGAGTKVRSGDKTTPLGVFRVGWISENSRFEKFIGLDYPNLDYAQRALDEERIDLITFHLIRRALADERTPPQDTPLGGFIGIHGVGAGDPSIHREFDWTEGCVALNNQQIRRLVAWVHVGTRVEIR